MSGGRAHVERPGAAVALCFRGVPARRPPRTTAVPHVSRLARQPVRPRARTTARPHGQPAQAAALNSWVRWVLA
ncbi:hypothetical protein GCM10009544_27050 [Streptomyces stramineus]|uniref:Uncharacterized protein n=1 Tax=Streptomyces stramineus TaxID=173861 RepID=A0ABN0ZYF5_9ACTN